MGNPEKKATASAQKKTAASQSQPSMRNFVISDQESGIVTELMVHGICIEIEKYKSWIEK